MAEELDQGPRLPGNWASHMVGLDPTLSPALVRQEQALDTGRSVDDIAEDGQLPELDGNLVDPRPERDNQKEIDPNSVRVRRHDGSFEDDWVLMPHDPGGDRVMLRKVNPDSQEDGIVMLMHKDQFEGLQRRRAEEEAEEESEEESEAAKEVDDRPPSRVFKGQMLLVFTKDGQPEEGWTAKGDSYERNGVRYITASKQRQSPSGAVINITHEFPLDNIRLDPAPKILESVEPVLTRGEPVIVDGQEGQWSYRGETPEGKLKLTRYNSELNDVESIEVDSSLVSPAIRAPSQSAEPQVPAYVTRQLAKLENPLPKNGEQDNIVETKYTEAQLREAINPLKILDLQDKVDAQLYRELHRAGYPRAGELRQINPKYADALESLARQKVIHGYLKNIIGENKPVPRALIDQVSSMLNLSEDVLVSLRLYERPSSEAKAPTEEEMKAYGKLKDRDAIDSKAKEIIEDLEPDPETKKRPPKDGEPLRKHLKDVFRNSSSMLKRLRELQKTAKKEGIHITDKEGKRITPKGWVLIYTLGVSVVALRRFMEPAASHGH